MLSSDVSMTASKPVVERKAITELTEGERSPAEARSRRQVRRPRRCYLDVQHAEHVHRLQCKHLAHPRQRGNGVDRGAGGIEQRSLALCALVAHEQFVRHHVGGVGAQQGGEWIPARFATVFAKNWLDVATC